jgi:hypothetical protein
LAFTPKRIIEKRCRCTWPTFVHPHISIQRTHPGFAHLHIYRRKKAMTSPLRRTAFVVLACLLTAILLLATPSASAQNISGSIFTTTVGGNTVNGNIYASKDAVYLDGGPQNTHANGLPDGFYYFQVTDPSGSVLLSTDDISCRVVQVVGGVVEGVPGTGGTDVTAGGAGNPACYHANGGIPAGTPNAGNGSIPVQLCSAIGCPGALPGPPQSFYNTPNPGGEYKAWLTPIANFNNCSTGGSPRSFGFCDSDSKTDNFKVRPANTASITACKFIDVDLDATFDPSGGDFLTAGWQITATGVDGGTVTQTTDQDGCTTFTFTFPKGITADTVTLTEVQQTGFNQVAPQDGSCTFVTGSSFNSGDTCSVTGGVITLTASQGDIIVAPFFGNTVNNIVTLTVGKTATGGNNFTWTINKTNNNTSNTVFSAGGGQSGPANYTVTVSHDAGTGWQVQGTIGISNPTMSDITGVNVTDTTTPSADLGCTVAAGTNVTIPALSTVSLNYTCTFSTNPGSGTNVATATVVATSASFSSPAVPFDFSSADTSATVTDTLAGNLGSVTINNDNSTSCTPDSSGTPANRSNPVSCSVSGSTATFTYSLTFTGDPAGTCTSHPNTATFTTNTGGTGTAGATVQDCQGADLTVSKTATASFNSSVSKSVDKTLVEQSGGTVTFHYTVTVSESGWTVSGNITVTNPNDFESVTTTVTDALSDSGGVCVVNGGSNTVTLTKSGTAGSIATLPYTCTFASRPTAVSGTNTATATWDATAAHTVHSSATGTAGYTFPTLTSTDNVQDSANPGGCTATLGTVSVTTTTVNPTPGCGITNLTSPSWGVFTYSITDTNSSPGTCTSFNNTAQITGGSSSNQVTVTVCNTNTGALTMGFWKNSNGQGIITKSCGGTSGTTLDAFLRQFNPFQDLSATATCKQDASYVATVIGAATCGGSTCNPMLRAQMLATALDVYFSTPSLGGNQIGAFNGLGNKTPALGGIAIDLSKICGASDGGGGGTCPEDARPEFGICTGTNTPVAGCTSGTLGTTVLQMLFYSDFPSSVNGNPVATPTTGASWYQQIKGKQVLAKDAFDSINNQTAPIAPSGTVGSPSF